ncbi:2-hydroxyacid dehydrogenase [uncultured Dysosmobacter sp.]|uniref:2-hydroxyacid dehydrogenase n=1 Tax=uncultured Dysosmobacter sp. TaxID=2591384 RepID=UPI00260AD492|nr:2-hydroxyacid dehydrogenase [uncultured Dysosmobacter sp.]
MKVMVLSMKAWYDHFAPKESPSYQNAELIFCDMASSEEDLLAACGDADALFVTPMSWVRESLISRMPNLKIIQSEGVGFDRIDLDSAKKRDIYVCNSAGCNAGQVAELSVTLMSMLLRRTLWGNRMVRAGCLGDAMQMLERNVPRDLSSVSVGLVGFGNIGQATAKRLRINGSQVFYYCRHRKPLEVEQHFGVKYLLLEDLTAQCDIISLHLPATAESTHMVNRDFLFRMKPESYLINTARGAIVDNDALCEAIRSGHLAGAALDTYAPEPVSANHPLLKLAAEFPDSLILCPHQAGITVSSFRNVYQMLFENLELLMEEQRPKRIVNGL